MKNLIALLSVLVVFPFETRAQDKIGHLNRIGLSPLPLIIASFEPELLYIIIQAERSIQPKWSTVVVIRTMVPSKNYGNLFIATFGGRRYLLSNFEGLWLGASLGIGYQEDESVNYSLLLSPTIGYLKQWSRIAIEFEGGIAPRYNLNRTDPNRKFDSEWKIGPAGNIALCFAF